MTRATLLTLGTLVLGGCWPRIPGTWPDNELNGATIVGMFEWNTFMGGYWDAEDSGAAWWGYLEEPLDVHAWQMNAPTLGECARNHDGPDFFGSFRDLGVDRVDLRGPRGNVRMDLSDGPLFYAELQAGDYVADESWDLDPIDTDVGELDIPGFVRTPPGFKWTAPAVGDPSPATMARGDDIVFEWSDGDPDYVVVSAILLDSQFRALDVIRCVVTDHDEFTIAAAELQGLSAAAGVMLSVGHYREGRRRVGDSGGRNRMAGGMVKHGVVMFE